ncbi:MAG TPA: exosortase A [Gammaproteobacteria bacterium]|nr:exosortase A [Gammaproteobacteria bacterium]
MNDYEETPALAAGWFRALILLTFCLILLLIVFLPTFRDIVSLWWRSSTYNHGFLILPIVGYLIWQSRHRMASLTPAPSLVAVVVMLGASLLWVMGKLAGVAVVEQFAAVAMLPVTAWGILGTKVAQTLLFPLTYILFAVPAGDFLVGPLQDITAEFVVWALKLTGIPVYLEGRYFYIPSGAFEVAEACSGVGYLIASLALGTLYAYLTYRSPWRRLAFIVLSGVVPIVANGVRAYVIVMIADLSDYTLAVSIDHIIYGWVFFGVVMLLLFWLGSLFREDIRDPAEEPGPVMPSTGDGPRGNVLLAAGLIVVLALATKGMVILDAARTAGIPEAAVGLPAGQGGWEGPVTAGDGWRPRFRKAEELVGDYGRGSSAVRLYLAYYSGRDRDAELINWANRLYGDEHRRLDEWRESMDLPGRGRWRVNAVLIEDDAERRLLWYWYEVGGTPTISKVEAKALALRQRLLGGEQGAAAWVIGTVVPGDVEESSRVLRDYLREMLPVLKVAEVRQ